MINRKGASVSPCRIPANMGNDDVSPSVDNTVDDASVYFTLMASMILSGMPYSLSISNIFDLSTGSKALEKSTNTKARCNLLRFDSSISLRRQRIWLKVDLPFLDPFWFLRSISPQKE